MRRIKSTVLSFISLLVFSNISIISATTDNIVATGDNAPTSMVMIVMIGAALVALVMVFVILTRKKRK